MVYVTLPLLVTMAAACAEMNELNIITHRFSEPCWYAAYTYSRHEYTVAEQLASRGIEFFLPEYRSTRHWNDRRVRLTLPLFPGYVFVRIELPKRMFVLRVPSIVRLVGPKGQPTPLPEEEIEALQKTVRGSAAEPHSFLNKGSWVRVTSGPLAGVQGIVLNRKRPYRLILSVALIQHSVSVELGANDVQPIQVPINPQTDGFPS